MAKKRALSQVESFLADIGVHPDDDTPRLVCADWLDDHGQPQRAELIRLQCRLARMSEDDPEWQALQQREWELLTLHRQDWREGLPAWVKKERIEVRRGFVAWTSTTATNFLRHGEALFRAAPVEGVRLRCVVERQLRDIAACPHLARLSALDLRANHLNAQRLSVLTASPHLTRLTRLGLQRTGIDVDAVGVLAAWPPLARITHLDLGGNGFTAAHIKKLVASKHLTALTSLDLTDSHNLLPAGIRALTASPRVASLERLIVAACGVGHEGLQILATSSRSMPRLTTLDVQGHWIGAPEGARALADAPLCRWLASLDLSATNLRSEGVEALVGGHFTALRHLRLGHNHINPQGAEALARSPHLAGLKSLDLDYNQIGSRGARALASSPHLAGLTSLHLGDNDIDAAGAAAVAASPYLTGLTSLNLSQNPIGDEGVQALAASPSMANLRTLSLGETGLTHKAALALASSPWLGNLRKLALRGNNSVFSAEGYRLLAEASSLRNLIILSITFDDPDSELVQR